MKGVIGWYKDYVAKLKEENGMLERRVGDVEEENGRLKGEI
jgi:hypothetical protein